MGTVKAIVGFLVIVGVIYAGFQILPPELSNYSFQDDLRTVAMTGGANPHQTDQDLMDAVIKSSARSPGFGRQQVSAISHAEQWWAWESGVQNERPLLEGRIDSAN